MKKIKTFLVILILLFFIFPIKVNAEIISYKDWETDEIYNYDVSSYEELYSVYEDLNYDYEKCQEELKSQISNLEDEILRLNEKISELENNEEYNIEYSKNEINGLHTMYIIIIIIMGIVIYRMHKDKK